jgi:hypothetical protein
MMRSSWRSTAASVIAIVVMAVAGCAAAADVTTDELSAVVERDGVAWDSSSVPDGVLGRLGQHRVVLLGETHHLREHWAFVATLMSDLHDDGFRQLLIEAPHMAGWLLDDYVQGGPLVPEWEAPPFYERRLSAIRAFNETLAPDERIHVRGIDANEEWYGGASDFQLLLGWVVDRLPTPGAVDVSLGGNYPEATSAAQTEAIEALLDSLEADRSALVESWGADWYDQVVEMAEVELASIDVRAQRREDDNNGARAREEVIKHLVDERVAECSCSTLINIGGHHAQKSHLMGTEQEWMGDYLAHKSTVVEGSIIVVGVSSARTELEPGAGGTPFHILASVSPDNELLRLMAETWPGQTVFLPLADPLFSDRTVAYNSEDVIYATSLNEQYDAIIQYGFAHRMPED